MKNLHPARKRLLVGCLFLLATFFYAFAGTCGLVGRLVQYVTSRLLGQTGSTLLAFAMLTTGVLFIVPHDAFGRLFRWVLHGRESRVAKVVRDSDEWVRAAEVKRIVADAIKAHEGMQAAKVEAEPELSVVDRRKLDDVRTCLKQLQYLRHEYEPVVQAITDLTPPTEVLVKNAIRVLSKSGSKATRVGTN